MNKTATNAIFVSLLSVFAVACGDPGGTAFEDGLDFDPETFEGDEVASDVQGDDGEVGSEDVFSPADGFDELVETGSDGRLREELFEPGVLEPIGGTTSSLAEPGLYEAKIEIKVDLVSTAPAAASEVDSCQGGLILDVRSSTATADGRCVVFNSILEYALIVDLVDAERIEGEIDFVFEGQSNVVPVTGVFNQGLLSLEFEGVTLVRPNVRGVWLGAVASELR